MAKYSNAVIRRAIASKIMECKNKKECEFIDDVSDWTVYKVNEKYHLIKFASKTNDGYKFTFDESKIVEHYDDNIVNIFKFLHFNQQDNKDNDEKCENIEDTVDFNFYLVLYDNSDIADFSNNQTKNFKYLALNKGLFTNCKSTKIIIPKISKCFNSLTSTGFKVKENPNDSNKYEINLYPYPCNYNLHNINELENVEISTEDCFNIQTAKNEENLPNIDYNRILERSFIYQIEYGTKEEFDKILTTCCENNTNDCCKKLTLDCKDKVIFGHLRSFISENQEKIKRKESITKFNKLSESYKKDLCINDFKKIFKCFFEKQIPSKSFREKFFDSKIVRKCAYCGVPECKLNLLTTVRAGRGNRLEYDRIISRDGNDKVGYTVDNIVLACYWCNNAKTDTFSPKEFKPIAKGINEVWNKKLKKQPSNENIENIKNIKNICFEENSEIWSYDK